MQLAFSQACPKANILKPAGPAILAEVKAPPVNLLLSDKLTQSRGVEAVEAGRRSKQAGDTTRGGEAKARNALAKKKLISSSKPWSLGGGSPTARQSRQSGNLKAGQNKQGPNCQP